MLFEGLKLSLQAGEAAALVGANGSGKTSLLRVIAGLIRPTAGRVRFAGPDGDLDAEEARGRGLHLLGHHDGLKSTRTAWEEHLFHTRWTGGDEASAWAALEAFGVERRLIGELMAGHLAGGGMILAAVHDPLPIAARIVEIAA